MVQEIYVTLYTGLLLHYFDVLYHLGGPLLVSPLSKTKGSRGVSPPIGCLLLQKPSLVFLGKCYECILILGHKVQPHYA